MIIIGDCKLIPVLIVHWTVLPAVGRVLDRVSTVWDDVVSGGTVGDDLIWIVSETATVNIEHNINVALSLANFWVHFSVYQLITLE